MNKLKVQAVLGDKITIAAIARRARKNPQFADWKAVDCEISVTVVHLNGCPLDLEALLESSDRDFTYDLLGIRYSLDKATGRFGDGFKPRSSRVFQ